MKYIPNTLSAMRILLSLLLFLTRPLSTGFFAIYLMCGLSDMLDGYFARKFGAASKFGAALDSLGDFIMILIVLYMMFPYLDLTLTVMLWIGAIGVIRIASGIVSFLKYKTFVFLHTYGNKATGFLLFCFPVLFMFLGVEKAAVFLCVTATISAVEELLIQIKSKKLNQDIISIFHL